MGLMSEEDQKSVRDMFKEMPKRVTVALFTQSQNNDSTAIPCTYCKETQEIIQEVTSLSDKIQLQIYDFEKENEKAKSYGVDKIPAIVLLGENGEDYGIKFYGIPSGYEFGTIIEDIVMISKGDSELSSDAKSNIKTITKDTHIQVFVTPTWPYCPAAVRLAHKLAFENPYIKADMVEATEFPNLSEKHNVYGVPKTVVNGGASFEGAVPENVFVDQVLNA